MPRSAAMELVRLRMTAAVLPAQEREKLAMKPAGRDMLVEKPRSAGGVQSAGARRTVSSEGAKAFLGERCRAGGRTPQGVEIAGCARR